MAPSLHIVTYVDEIPLSLLFSRLKTSLCVLPAKKSFEIGQKPFRKQALRTFCCLWVPARCRGPTQRSSVLIWALHVRHRDSEIELQGRGFTPYLPNGPQKATWPCVSVPKNSLGKSACCGGWLLCSLEMACGGFQILSPDHTTSEWGVLRCLPDGFAAPSHSSSSSRFKFAPCNQFSSLLACLECVKQRFFRPFV